MGGRWREAGRQAECVSGGEFQCVCVLLWLWTRAKASGGGPVSRSLWGRGPRLREVALHLGLERELWLLHSLGCHLSTPLAWRSGLKNWPTAGVRVALGE